MIVPINAKVTYFIFKRIESHIVVSVKFTISVGKQIECSYISVRENLRLALRLGEI